MSRYIDADKLLEFCNNAKSKTIDYNDIARFPSIDIVHCKECKYCSIDFIGDYKCDSHRMEVIEEDDYCSYGERKDE